MNSEKLIFQNSGESDWLDERLFNELFEMYWKKLFGFCRHHIDDPEVCKGIVQQVFLSLWERRKTLDVQVNLGHYLFGAVRLRIARYYRDQSNIQRSLALGSEHFSDSTNQTEEEIHFADLNQIVESTVADLPQRCRQVYELSRNNGMTLPDIASELGISIKTAEAHLTKALKRLRCEIQAAEIYHV